MKFLLFTIFFILNNLAYSKNQKSSQINQVVIDHLSKNSPLRNLGLQEKDIIVSLNKDPVLSLKDFIEKVKQLPNKKKAIITILRDSKEMEVEIKKNQTKQEGEK